MDIIKEICWVARKGCVITVNNYDYRSRQQILIGDGKVTKVYTILGVERSRSFDPEQVAFGTRLNLKGLTQEDILKGRIRVGMRILV